MDEHTVPGGIDRDLAHLAQVDTFGMAVVTGKLALCVWPPGLDAKRNWQAGLRALGLFITATGRVLFQTDLAGSGKPGCGFAVRHPDGSCLPAARLLFVLQLPNSGRFSTRLPNGLHQIKTVVCIFDSGRI